MTISSSLEVGGGQHRQRLVSWKEISAGQQFFILLLALLYGVFLGSRPLFGFKDRENYFDYFIVSGSLFDVRLDAGPFSMLANEPIWLLVAEAMGKLFGPETSMRLLITLPAIAVAFVVLRFTSRDILWALIILLLPLVLKNHIIHLRQGFALAIFLIGYLLVKRRSLRLALILVTPLIHSSFYFVVILILLSKVFSLSRLRTSHAVVLVATLCGVLAYMLPSILELSAARQVETLDHSGGNVSGIGFVFWLGILILILYSGADERKRLSFPITVLIFYCSTYFIFEYAGRILESAVVVILLSLGGLPRMQRQLAMFAICLFFIFTWIPRIGVAGWGWGV